jgi:hypothetical protein
MFSDLLRPEAKYPTYPPYHKDFYLEEYFFHWVLDNKINLNRNYINIFWTNIYCNVAAGKSGRINIQNYINLLNSDLKYFTICQHDDGPFEALPRDTLIFSAGGNKITNNTVPIPLICSRIENTFINESKTFLCSFVGSPTHSIRNQLISKWANDEDFIFGMQQHWMESVPKKNLSLFKTLTCKSKFTLCPRGYGKSSFRLYETMQLGSVPVYVSDYHYLPWTDELDWSEFCVLIKPDQIDDLKNILLSYSEEKINKMIKTAQTLYDEYFSLEGMCKKIIQRLQ